MKKQYFASLALTVLGIISLAIFFILGSEVNENGTLIEPFFLVIIGWGLILLGLLALVITGIWFWVQKKAGFGEKVITCVGIITLFVLGGLIVLAATRNNKTLTYLAVSISNPKIKDGNVRIFQ